MGRYTSGLRFSFPLTIGLAGACWAQTEDSSFQRGAALYRSGDCRAAMPLLDRSAATNPRANLLLGRCHFESQQWAKALEAFTAYQKSAPGDPEAAILVARAQERAGHGETAVSTLNDFLKLYPNKQSVRTALGDLYVRLGRGSDAMTQ